MIRRQTIVFIVVLGLVAALAWYTQQPGNIVTQAINSGATPTKPNLGYLIPTGHGSINVLKVENDSGKSVTITRGSDGTWSLDVGSGPEKANQSAAEEAASQALYMSIVANVDNPPGLDTLGISKPTLLITATISDGTTYNFKVGKQTVTGSGYYVQKSDGTVTIVSKDSIDPLTTLVTSPPFPATPTPAGTVSPAATASVEATATP